MSGSQTPILLPKLRAALGRLYSLPGCPPSHDLAADAAVHTFLVDLQSRNVRRRRESHLKSLRAREDGSAYHDMTAAPLESDVGSTWLACLCLLTIPDAHHAERLFAAQTLLGRLRSLGWLRPSTWKPNHLISILQHQLTTPPCTLLMLRAFIHFWGWLRANVHIIITIKLWA